MEKEYVYELEKKRFFECCGIDINNILKSKNRINENFSETFNIEIKRLKKKNNFKILDMMKILEEYVTTFDLLIQLIDGENLQALKKEMDYCNKIKGI